jgi:AraC-like DNA-binding protein
MCASGLLLLRDHYDGPLGERMTTLLDFLLARPKLLWSRAGPARRLLRWSLEECANILRILAVAVDVLSEVLSAVRLTGSVFFDVSATSPWVAEAPPSAQIADAVRPGAHHAIEYHLLTQGSCWISIVDGAPFEPIQLQEGDIAVIPHGEPHALSSAPGMRAEPNLDAHRRPQDDSSLPFKLRMGDDATSDARLICGFFTCDIRPFNPLLEALPRFMRIGRGASSGPDGVVEQFIRMASAEASERRAGTQSVLNKLSELMFIEAIRTYMDQLSGENTGWFSGLRDPLVGRALSLLHAQPARSWTLEELAEESGASRSGLVGRFTHVMGYPPIQYLTRWRMQLAARRLGDRGAKVAAVALEVGYDSEAAFSRAFKKFSGRSPSDWRS